MGTVFESQATYTCNDGFIISSGNGTRTCEANGEWSGSEPTCGKQPINSNHAATGTIE